MPPPSWSLHCGDALDWLETLDTGSVNAVITDPPYGINTKSDGMGKLSPWADLCNAAFWYAAWMRECRRVLTRDGCLWTCLNWRSLPTFQKASCDLGWPIDSMLVWDKQGIGPGGSRGLRPRYELVALLGMPDFAIRNRSLPDIVTIPWPTVKPHGHPAEKPEALVAWLLRAIDAKPGQIIIDPFSGSGTTGATALQHGCHFQGAELDLAWHGKASARIDAATTSEQLSLLA